MKSAKTVLVLVLALAAIGGFTLVWHQHRELVELRSAALKASERADLQKKIWDLERANRELRDRLAAPGAARGDGAGDRNARPAEGRGDRAAPARPDAQLERVRTMQVARNLINRPEVRAALDLQRKIDVDQRYGAFLRSLTLSPEQIAKLKGLLGDRMNVRQDVIAAAIDQGVDPTADQATLRKVAVTTQEDIVNNLKGLLGDSGFSQLQLYDATAGQRGVVDQLQQRLTYNSEPLSPTQADQLALILANNPAPRPATAPANVTPAAVNNVFGGAIGAGVVNNLVNGGVATTITPAAVAQAQTILSPSQFEALQQLQLLQQTLRDAASQRSSLPPPAPPPPPAPTNVTPRGGR